MLEIAERWGYKPSEMLELDAREFLLLVEYQSRRPPGMHDDVRAYRQIQMTSMAEKLPALEELFPALAVVVKERNQSEEAQVAAINKNPFIKFVREKAREAGEEILKMESE